ncbi:MAG: stage III sporulation protein AA [Lachnospiraceae bacterium]|nr:stage III sporulation protein AA [Lachnospiraceae bacterium]
MEKTTDTSLREEILKVLSVKIRSIVERMQVDFRDMQEIRIRADAPFMVVYHGEEYFVSEDGRMTQKMMYPYWIKQSEVKETMEFISNYSLYAFEEELRQGFITIQGGHRVGVAGKIILEKDRIKNIRYISFINIRLAHQVLGCADDVIPYVLQGSSVYHTLIISPPRCGKTTLLRDMIRQLSNGVHGRKGLTVGVVDERSELGACYQGRPQNDLGYRTDILDCCPKKEGMMMLVRSMSPKVIAVDEIGFCEDIEALEYVMNCGVKVLATVHGRSMEEIRNKPVLGRMIREKIFQRYIVLSGGQVGKIEAVYDERGEYLTCKSY